MRASYPGRWLVILGIAAWVLSVLYVVACLAASSLSGFPLLRYTNRLLKRSSRADA